MMAVAFAAGVGVLVAAAVVLLLQARTYPVVLGVVMLSYAVNLFLFASGGLRRNAAPVVGTAEVLADPLPQALVLTAIVISFAMTALLVVVAVRARQAFGDDHVDVSPGEDGDE